MDTHTQLTRVGNNIVLPIQEEHHEPVVVDEWRSCCFRLSPQFIAYFGQLFITSSIIALCAYMLIVADGDCNRSSPFFSLLSFMLGKILSSVITSSKAN
jgi:hypothetical protein